jgi:hypothetical protein
MDGVGFEERGRYPKADEGWVLAEMMIEACFDHGHSQEWPLTPALSPKGRGIKATATQ